MWEIRMSLNVLILESNVFTSDFRDFNMIQFFTAHISTMKEKENNLQMGLFVFG